MAWRYQEDYIRAGGSIDPREITRTFTAFASEFNGFLDGDNITPVNALTQGKIAVSTFNTLGIKRITNTVNLTSADANQWVQLSELKDDVTCVDGFMQVDAWVQCETQGVLVPTTGAEFTEIQLLIAKTGWISNIRTLRCHHLTAACAVGAGTVTVAMRIKVYRRNPALLEYVSQGQLSSMSAVQLATYQQAFPNNNINVTSGALIWRHGKR
jgi:hypothetical protein